MIILVRGVIARLQRDSSKCRRSRVKNVPEFLYIYGPVTAFWGFDGVFWWVQWNINGLATIEGDRGEILVEKWFEHDNFISLL